MLSRTPSVVENWDITTNFLSNILICAFGDNSASRNIIAAKMQSMLGMGFSSTMAEQSLGHITLV